VVSNITKLVFRLERRIWWCVLSNAALRLREMMSFAVFVLF